MAEPTTSVLSAASTSAVSLRLMQFVLSVPFLQGKITRHVAYRRSCYSDRFVISLLYHCARIRMYSRMSLLRWCILPSDVGFTYLMGLFSCAV